MNTVLVQEMVRYNRLLSVIRDSLESLKLALAGLQVMSGDLDTACKSMAVNAVPTMWAKVSYPSLKPLASYLEDLYKRLAMLRDWASNGAPVVFWMSGFFFVHSFLTAGLQNFARRTGTPIDMVAYDHVMLNGTPEGHKTAPEEGVYVHGNYVEGAAWDCQTMELCESRPKVLFVPAPVMWLVPHQAASLPSRPHYVCPLYRTSERRGVLATTGHSTNFVMFVRMPTSQDPQHWVMRGVALLS